MGRHGAIIAVGHGARVHLPDIVRAQSGGHALQRGEQQFGDGWPVLRNAAAAG